MKHISLSVKSFIAGIVAFFFFFATAASAAAGVSSKEPPAATSCATPAYRQFDFWAGDWDVFDIGSPTKVAHARVDLILDGCVLREDYQGTDGHTGQSFTIYDAARNVWHQSWVTNRGQLLEIEGKLVDGKMVLSGEDNAAGGIVRGTWQAMGKEVLETAVTSTDNGKTWKPWFDLLFRPTTGAMEDSSTPSSDVREIVAAIDTQYQAASKEMMQELWTAFW
jgi:hypothetical protein